MIAEKAIYHQQQIEYVVYFNGHGCCLAVFASSVPSATMLLRLIRILKTISVNITAEIYSNNKIIFIIASTELQK